MYYGSIILSNFMNTEIHEREVNGKLEECISIPILSNGLIFGKKRIVVMRFLCRDRKPNPENVSHYISMYIPDKSLSDRIEKLGFENNFKFIGSLKPSFITHKRNRDKNTSLDEAMDKD